MKRSSRIRRRSELSDLYYSIALYLLRNRLRGTWRPLTEQAIALNPNNADALGAYAQWLMTHGRADDADALFREAHTSSTGGPLARAMSTTRNTSRTREDMDDVARARETRSPQLSRRARLRELARVYETHGRRSTWASPGDSRPCKRTLEIAETRGQVAELYARIGDFDDGQQNSSPNRSSGQLWFQRRYEN